MTENNNQKPILQPFLQDKTGESVPEIIDFYGAIFSQAQCPDTHSRVSKKNN